MSRKALGPTDRYIASRIRLRRIQLGTSQEELARVLGVSFQQVQKYERGRNRISAGRLQDLARALQVPLHFFYADAAGSDPQPPREEPAILSAILGSHQAAVVVGAFARIRSPRLRQALAELMAALGDEGAAEPPAASQRSPAQELKQSG
jgi:transcriptional regulator with XRE-family HTH domain